MLIDKGVDVQMKSDLGNTALYVAAQNGHLDCTKILIESGAGVNDKSKGGWTALHIASQNPEIELLCLSMPDRSDIPERGWFLPALKSVREFGKTMVLVCKSESLEAIKSGADWHDISESIPIRVNYIGSSNGGAG
jgi:hypothetical protein